MTDTNPTEPAITADTVLSIDNARKGLTATVEQLSRALSEARKTRDTLNGEIRRMSDELDTARRVLNSFTPRRSRKATVTDIAAVAGKRQAKAKSK